MHCYILGLGCNYILWFILFQRPYQVDVIILWNSLCSIALTVNLIILCDFTHVHVASTLILICVLYHPALMQATETTCTLLKSSYMHITKTMHTHTLVKQTRPGRHIQTF